MTAAAERDDKFHADYIPPPLPAPGQIWVRSPVNSKGHPVFPDLHLMPEQAQQLVEALEDALNAYLELNDGG